MQFRKLDALKNHVATYIINVDQFNLKEEKIRLRINDESRKRHGQGRPRVA
jgi:hypothetical protein